MRRSAAPSMRPVLKQPLALAPVHVPASAATPAAAPAQPPPPPPPSTSLLPVRGISKPAAFRPPVGAAVAGPARPPATDSSEAAGGLQLCFAVVWSKNANRKHIKWDGDALLLVHGRTCILKDTSGKDIGRSTTYSTNELATLKAGETLTIGQKFVEIQNAVAYDLYASGTFFIGSDARAPAASAGMPAMAAAALSGTRDTQFRSPVTAGVGAGAPSGGSEAVRKITRQPRHDPNGPDALVLPRPTADLIKRAGSAPGQIVDVVVDPYVTSVLRPHQREGVKFLYECVMGMKNISGMGAILADEMGLGKTLQVIALVWTLLKQNPYKDGGIIKNALIVCPASLVQNWQREFKKWLGDERLRTFAAVPSQSLHEYMATTIYPVLIIGYERFRQDWEVLEKAGFGIVVCDEGHRIKNAYIKTAQSLQSIQTRRRVILSGTPIQNDLGEFFAMIDFVNPGLMKDYATFRKVFEDPILASRQSTSTPAEVAIGQARSAELARLTKECILRRTSQINNKYLPPKSEFVLFCRPTQLQTDLYNLIVSSKFLRSWLVSSEVQAGKQPPQLLAILLLRQLCNAPAALTTTLQRSSVAMDEGDGASTGIVLEDGDLAAQILARLRAAAGSPATVGISAPGPPIESSGKLSAIRSMLQTFKQHHGERTVVVSNFSSTLDLLEGLCNMDGLPFVRLDGSTATDKRQALVDRFNSPSSNLAVFLLSARAGGVGLNLIGASRLVLVDPDWNPATDSQALARIWRDGQKRPVTTYRLLTAGTIDEKIYQRQLSKQALSDVVMDESEIKPSTFSREELMDVFSLHDTTCNTHDILECTCQGTDAARDQNQEPNSALSSSAKGNGKRPATAVTKTAKRTVLAEKTKKILANADLESWTHYGLATYESIKDESVSQLFSQLLVSFAFHKTFNVATDKNADTDQAMAETMTE